MRMNEKAKVRKQLRKAELNLAKYAKTNHILHLLLSILTAGLWIVVWVIVAISNATEVSRWNNRIVKLESQLDALEQ